MPAPIARRCVATRASWMILAGALLAALAAPAGAGSVLTREFSARYELSSGIITFGTTERSLKHNADGSYAFTSLTTPVDAISWFLDGKVEEQSIWRLQNDTVVPQTYLFEKIKGNKHKRLDLKFDWNAKVVTNHDPNHSWSLPIKAGVMDRHLYQLLIMDGLSTGKRQFHYQVVDGRKLKDFDFEVVGRESIAVPLGKFDTVKLKRIGDKRKTVFWCAPALGYLPVKIHQVERNGDDLDAVITELDGKTRLPPLPADGGS